MDNILYGLILSQMLLLPLAYKWELDFQKVIVGGLAAGFVAGCITDLLSVVFVMGLRWRLASLAALIVAISFVTLLFYFFRDSERVPPDKKDIVVAPADGTIKYIKRIEQGTVPVSSKGRESVPLNGPLMDVLPARQGYLVGIAMTFLDVHVTRAPIPGRLTFLEHIDGSFFSLKRPDAPYRNERSIQVIRNGKLGLGLIHIASRLVRRIDSYVSPGDELKLGQKIGMIRFGSQVDVVIPDGEDLRMEVNVGDRVFAGVSIIART